MTMRKNMTMAAMCSVLAVSGLAFSAGALADEDSDMSSDTSTMNNESMNNGMSGGAMTEDNDSAMSGADTDMNDDAMDDNDDEMDVGDNDDGMDNERLRQVSIAILHSGASKFAPLLSLSYATEADAMINWGLTVDKGTSEVLEE